MMRIIATSILCLAASTALAETAEFMRAGDWMAFGGTDKSGRSLCGLSTLAEGKRFELRYTLGEEAFTVDIGRDGWHVAGNAGHETLLRFDGHMPWTVALTKGSFTLPAEALGRFIAEFRDSNTLTALVRVDPPTAWAAGLTGSGDAGEVFLACSRELM